MAGIQNKQKMVYWSKMVKKLNDSGLSIKEFSTKYRLSSGKLAYWNRRLPQSTEKVSDFVEVKTVSSDHDSISLSINDVITINFDSLPSPEWISDLLERVKEVA